MKICVCDAEKLIRDDIKHMISRYQSDNTAEVSEFSCGKDLIEKIESGSRFDIAFIDIDMNNFSGIEVAERIKNLMPKTVIIFLSDYLDYLFEAFRLEALHFIVKPINERKFAEVFQRAIKKYTELNSSLVMKWKNNRYCIPINEISYVEGYQRHLIVYTPSRIYEAVGKVSEIFGILEPHGFIRVHQGYIVNMRYIKNFDANEVELTDGTRVMTSVRRRPDALRAFDLFADSLL